MRSNLRCNDTTLVHDASPAYRANRWLFRLLTTAIGMLWVALLLVSSVSHAYAAATGEVGDVEAGQLLLRGVGDSGYQPAVMQSSTVHFAISGMIATVTLEQVFRNDSQDFVEGLYSFPLPSEAAVRALEMHVGERRIVGKIREKQAAKKIYAQAKRAGKKASLVEQQRPNLFTNRVANIAPGEEVAIRLQYVQPVDYAMGTFSLRFPMTITPRFMPGVPLRELDNEPDLPAMEIAPYLGWALPTDEVPDAHLISPLLLPPSAVARGARNVIALSASLDMGMPLSMVNATYHDIVLSRRAGVYELALVDGVTEMDRDFLLQWQPVAGSAPEAAFFSEEVDGQHYGMLMVVPPAQPTAVAAIPRDVVFVVDTSGSMGGVSIEQARASVSLALRQLTKNDRFNIIAFDSSHRALHAQSVPATEHYVQHALEFVRTLSASGGTQMMPALRAALAVSDDLATGEESVRLRQVIFITDGAVGNEDALFREIEQRLGNSRMFTVGIGSAPNSWFMRKAAEFGRGTYTHIGDLNEVGDRMSVLFEQLARPAAVDFKIDWPIDSETWPQRVPDLYLGEPITVSASFGETPPVGEVTVSGRVGGKEWRRRIALHAVDSGPAHDGIASVWARRKIADILDQGLRGRDASSVRDEVLPLALEHSLMSPYTSFVAVEEVISRPRDAQLSSRAVPNSQPHGQSLQPFAYPSTATTGPAKIWFAALLVFVALILRVVRQGETDHVAPCKQP